MNALVYRRLRIAVGGLTLGFIALVFADIGDWIAPGLARLALWPQFAPSLLALATGAGWIAAGCVAVLALTLVFGRVYCAMLCPLGVLMDLAAKLAGRTGKRRHLPYRRGRTWLRTAVVLVCAGGLLAGLALPLAFLDPYSIFGKITAATLRPAVGAGNHALAATGWIQPLRVSPVAWITVGVALGLLVLVVVTAVSRGRLWCNTVCPVGTVLGFFSKHALFRLRIAESACVGCSMCERVCPAQCIDFRNHRIDHSRCVMCLDCVTSCKRNGIHLAWRGRRPEQPPEIARTPESAAISCFSDPPVVLPAIPRRTFLAASAVLPAVALAQGRGRGEGGGNGHGGGHGHGQGGGGDLATCRGGLNQHNKRPVLPPGAISLQHFQNLCTACHLCVTNCPDQVLRPSITQHGLAGFLQPFQDFEVSFCSYNCSNCSQICPTGALRPLRIEQRRLVRTGNVEFFKGRCVVKTEGTACGACAEHCPTQAVHMVPWKDGLTIPKIEPDLCVGCGGCEFICPVRPNKAILVNGLPVHERATLPELGRENTVREMEDDFPF